MLHVELKFIHDRIDEELVFPNVRSTDVQWLAVVLRADVPTPEGIAKLRSNLSIDDFAYWGQVTRTLSESGGEVRLYEPGGSGYATIPRWLLRAALDEWEQFLADGVEHTASWDFAPTVLDITDDDGHVVGSFESESSYYHEGRADEPTYADTGIVANWTSNMDEYESRIGSLYALAYTKDRRWVVIDDQRRLGGEVRRRPISGPEANAWFERNGITRLPANYRFD